ncbi:MAG: recombinase family protein [Alphaproteobacteria bacterium]
MKRCAVYTRKSTEEGLEQDFNSLHAQREACEAFIKSQKHEGWKLIKTAYDDGGISGGTMERPALKQLLAAIERHEIDVVVVYKVDRLTRSLADFAKIVELLDAHDVSFVSVTQQFNTTSSMGRLTLNVLLSFAQFEREVTAERIRDKIAASKKKGMWMGGPVPLGYDAKDRKLIINEAEAATVRRLYSLYLELGTVRKVKNETDRLGLVTKRRLSKAGNLSGGKSFSRGNLYEILSNPTYVGRIPAKDESYPGLHDAIINEETWNRVQDQLNGNAVGRASDTNNTSQMMLTGLVFDETGDPLTPTYANKKGRRYRYYVSNRVLIDASRHDDGWRLPARALEPVVKAMLVEWLDTDIQSYSSGDALISRKYSATVQNLREVLETGEPAEQATHIRSLVERIDLSPTAIKITMHRKTLAGLIGIDPEQIKEEALSIQRSITLRRRGVERKIVLTNGNRTGATHDPALCTLIGWSRRWFTELATGQISSVDAIADREKMNGSDVSRILQLAFLAPDIVDAILEGRQPIELTVRDLKRLGTLPADWQAQRRLLGFT